jgi:hypothetical protein
MSFNHGNDNFNIKNVVLYVLAVREGQPGALPGDANGDNVVDLNDAVITLQILSGISPQSTIFPSADIDGDLKISMAEAIYAIQKAAGLQ